MWKRFGHDYLSYTSRERTGIFILLGLTVLFLFIPLLYPYLHHKKQYDQNKFRNEIAKLKLRKPDSSTAKGYLGKKIDQDDFNNFAEPSEKNYHLKTPAEVFYFDPNTATIDEWKRLGVKTKTVETIQKYLAKGGHFYKPEDINKIWGLHANETKRLMPFVSIKPPQKNNQYPQNNLETNRTSYVPKTPITVEINSADTSAFIALPGIGSKLAQRIINFRDKLGGFNSIDQVSETFGLPDSTFQKIKSRLILSGTVKKININNASLNDLKTHPYIRYNLANAIIEYRAQHGNFSTVPDVKKIMMVTDEIYKKLEPYVTVE